MAKYHPCNKKQRIMLPISLQDQIVPSTLEYTLSELVKKRLDLSVLYVRSNNDKVGAACLLRERCISNSGISLRYLSVHSENQPPNWMAATKSKTYRKLASGSMAGT